MQFLPPLNELQFPQKKGLQDFISAHATKETMDNPNGNIDSHDLYNNQHYNLALNKKNLNARIKPSVFSSKIPSNNNDMDAVTRRRILSRISSKSSVTSSLAGGMIFSSFVLFLLISLTVSLFLEDNDFIRSLTSRIKKLEEEIDVHKHNLSMKDVQIVELENKSRKTSEISERNETLMNIISEMIEYMNSQKLDHKWKRLSIDKSEKRYNSLQAAKEIRTPRSSNYTTSSEKINKLINLPDINSKVHQSLGVECQISNSSESNSEDENATFKQDFRLNMDVVKQKIKDLNSLVPDQQTNTYIGNIKQLTKKLECNIIFYKNGIVAGNGSFRPYTWDITKAFLNDIADGYFPYEFKERHPDGVKLNVIDKTNEIYSKNTEVNKKLADYKTNNIKDLVFLKVKDEQAKIVDAQSLLNQLPKVLIKNGKIIPIRSDIENLVYPLSNAPFKATQISTDCERHSELYPNRKKTIVKVSCPCNNSNYTLQLWSDETIGEIKKYLQPYLGKEVNWQLRTAFPSQILIDDCISLEKAKLLNAKLIVT